MTVRTISDEGELAELAKEILSLLSDQGKQGGEKNSAQVLALQGDLGAGKTAFVRSLARELGIQEHITSPTFVLMKQYLVLGHPWVKQLVHIDAYRLEKEEEAEVLKLDTLYGEKGNLICIEWPERIGGRIPKDVFDIGIEILEDGKRKITYGS